MYIFLVLVYTTGIIGKLIFLDMYDVQKKSF